jgi:Uma2 family endonuclease
MSTRTPSGSPGPTADERLVAPESRYEIEDGKVRYVPPSDEPHGSRHSKLSALLEAHAADAYDVASDMLTRTSEIDDFAPDASVFLRERDETGQRRLEELAFEVVSTESLGHAGSKAATLTARGVRRVFAIDVGRRRAFEWSRQTAGWRMLDSSGAIEDAALGASLPLDALVFAAKADDAMAGTLLSKNNPVLAAALSTSHGRGLVEGRAEGLVEGRAEGLATALLAVLAGRGLMLEDSQRLRIASEHRPAVLTRWLSGAATCQDVETLLARR